MEPSNVLVIELEPNLDDSGHPGEYYEHLHLWQRDQSWVWSSVAEQSRRLSESEVQPEFFQRIEPVFKRKLRGEPLAFEFVLPEFLLVRAFDQWRRSEDSRPLGKRCAVAVRCRDRYDEWEACDYWHEAWALLQEEWNCPTSMTQIVVACADDELAAPDKLNDRLDDERGKAIVVLVVGPGDLKSPSDHARLIRAILHGGALLALWLRERPTVPTEAACAVLSRTIAHCSTLGVLPDAVRKLRCQIKGVEASLSRYVTLLFDDPARLPPRELVSP